MKRRSWRRHPGLIPQAGTLLWRAMRWLVTRPAFWAIMIVGLGGGGGAWHLITHSDAFRVEQIETPQEMRFTIPKGVIGRNVWTVDLRHLAAQLKAQRPHLKRVRVFRRLPQTLVVDVLARVPVAQVQRAGSAGSLWHPIDRDGFLLPSMGRAPSEHLVILKGIEVEEDMLRAVRVAEQLQRAPVLIGHRVTSVDVQDPEQLIVVLDDAMEVRFGREDQLAQQLNRLRTVLHVIAQRSVEARYLDVRFEEPVIGPRKSLNYADINADPRR